MIGGPAAPLTAPNDKRDGKVGMSQGTRHTPTVGLCAALTVCHPVLRHAIAPVRLARRPRRDRYSWVRMMAFQAPLSRSCLPFNAEPFHDPRTAPVLSPFQFESSRHSRGRFNCVSYPFYYPWIRFRVHHWTPLPVVGGRDSLCRSSLPTVGTITMTGCDRYHESLLPFILPDVLLR